MQNVILTVDVVLLTLLEGQLSVALFKRDKAPFEGEYALPGGYVHVDKDRTAFDAALRTLVAKTGITTPYLEQLATFSGQARDPRGWSSSIVYYALVPVGELAPAQNAEMRVVPIAQLPDTLPFDHREIVECAVSRVRAKSGYSSLPVHLLEKRFTIPQLQLVYEQVLGERLDKVTFRKKVLMLGILDVVAGAFEHRGDCRPAQLYQLNRKFKHSLATTPRAFKL